MSPGTTMMDFLLFCLASIGMTLILVRGSIFRSYREFLANETNRIRRRREKKGQFSGFTLIEFFHGMITCVQCTGFWCGIFCGLFLISSDGIWVSLGSIGLRHLVNRVLMLFCCGAVSSFLSPLGDMLLEWLFCVKELRVRELEADDRRRAEAAEQQNLEAPTEQPE